MALTQEQQVIFDAVLSSLRTNSKTIEQLTPQTSLDSNDWFELNGGRKVSYTVLSNLISALTSSELNSLKTLIGKNVLKSASFDVEESTATLIIKSVGATILCNVPVATSKKAGIITALDKAKIQMAISTADAAKEVTDTKGQPGGLATLGENGLVPQNQLPDAVRNAVEFSGILQLFTIPEIETSSAASGDIFFLPLTGTFLCRTTISDGMKFYANWYEADLFGTLTATGRKPALGKAYIDVSQQRQYFYDGSELVPVSADFAKRLALAQPVRCADEEELAAKAASAEVGQQFYIPEED